MKRSILLAVFLTFTLGTAISGQADEPFSQGFETDTSGWIDFGGTITRVPSGTSGIPSSKGGFHAEAGVSGSGIFTRFGEYRGTWPGFVKQFLDVYIDPAKGNLDDGWWLDNALTCSEFARTDPATLLALPNCDPAGGSGPLGWLEAGGVGAKKILCGGTTEGWAIAADADGAGNPSGGGVCITAPGWYTILSSWVESSSNTGNPDTDTIDRNTFIFDSNGVQIYENLNPKQHLLKNAGGNRYAWLNAGGSVPQRFAGLLAIDNSVLLVPSVAASADHLQCYDVKKSTKLDPKPIVNLDDQFAVRENVQVKEKAELYCTPVDKNGEGIGNPDNHLTCYKVEGYKPNRKITIENQFGQQSFELKDSELLCVPSLQTDVQDTKKGGHDDDDDDD
ncbi:MAG: hypothetical protein NPINA01_09600 [Nitrospinaceae bacterium]|nr:MAG: hypothetical protein NPINA01_09600 [Nitrospinaceae bacterium]